MLYIFEGADLTGKTTLANMLSSKLKIPVCKPKRPMDLKDSPAWNKIANEEMEFFEKFITPEKNLILDRVVWIDENVYAPVFRKVTRPDLFERGKNWRVPMVIIYCECDYEEKEWRNSKRKEEKWLLNEEIDTRLINEYEKILKKLTPIKYIRVNTSTEDAETWYLDMEKFLEYLGCIK